MINTVTAEVVVENGDMVRADRLLEGQLVIRRNYVATVKSVVFNDNGTEVTVRLRFPHKDMATGMEWFVTDRGAMFQTLRVSLV